MVFEQERHLRERDCCIHNFNQTKKAILINTKRTVVNTVAVLTLSTMFVTAQPTQATRRCGNRGSCKAERSAGSVLQ